MSILIFTDGSSRGNPGPGGWGAIIHAGDRVVELGGAEKNTTNNRMELMAAIAALEWIGENKAGLVGADMATTIVKSDSKYVIQGITMWVAGWKRNGWKTAGKKDVGNRDLWERLSAAVSDLSIQWHHVDGHIGIAGNERCDEIATSFADGIKIDLYDGPFAAYTIDLHFKDMTPEQAIEKKAKQAKKSRSSSSSKAYSYLSLVDGVLEKHKTWVECEARVKGVKGAKFKKSTSAVNEEVIIKEWGI